MDWILCSERLPENGDYSVLCYFTNGSVEPVRMAHVQDWAEGKIDDIVSITHWMPMPSPPEAG